MKVVLVSDTHGKHPELPPGDVLVHCGDLTHFGSFAELKSEVEWLKSLPFKHLVLIAGNHDVALGNLHAKGLEERTRELLFGRIHYLRDSGVEIDGVKFWGSPWIPPYAGEFNLPEEKLRAKWSLIPSDTDVLITHGPPAGILDAGTGSKTLCAAVQLAKPKVHCFGHVHEARGDEELDGTKFFNCATAPFSVSLPVPCSP